MTAETETTEPTTDPNNEATTPEERKNAVVVGRVEGHPIYFDTKEGKLYALVNGKRIEHKTFSTLRSLVFQEHLRGLRALPALVVKVPANDRWAGQIYTPAERKLVGTNIGYRGAHQVVDVAGTSFEQPAYAVIPADAGPEVLESVKATIAAFKAEEEAESARHEAAQTDINTRALEYARSLGEQYPVETIYDRLKTIESETDRSTYVEWAKRSR
jgi:hypothetical protein